MMVRNLPLAKTSVPGSRPQISVTNTQAVSSIVPGTGLFRALGHNAAPSEQVTTEEFASLPAKVKQGVLKLTIGMQESSPTLGSELYSAPASSGLTQRWNLLKQSKSGVHPPEKKSSETLSSLKVAQAYSKKQQTLGNKVPAKRHTVIDTVEMKSLDQTSDLHSEQERGSLSRNQPKVVPDSHKMRRSGQPTALTKDLPTRSKLDESKVRSNSLSKHSAKSNGKGIVVVQSPNQTNGQDQSQDFHSEVQPQSCAMVETKDITLPVMNDSKVNLNQKGIKSNVTPVIKVDNSKAPEKVVRAYQQSDIVRSASVKSLSNMREITRYFMLPKTSAGWNREPKKESVLTERRARSPESHTVEDQSSLTNLEDENLNAKRAIPPTKKLHGTKATSKLFNTTSWTKMIRNSGDSPLHSAFKNMVQKLEAKEMSSPQSYPIGSLTSRIGLLADATLKSQEFKDKTISKHRIEKSDGESQNAKKLSVLEIIENTIHRLMDKRAVPKSLSTKRSRSIQTQDSKPSIIKLRDKLIGGASGGLSRDPNQAAFTYLQSQWQDSSRYSKTIEERSKNLAANHKESSCLVQSLAKSQLQPALDAPVKPLGLGSNTSASLQKSSKATPIQALIGKLSGYTQSHLGHGRIVAASSKGSRGLSHSKTILNASSARDSLQKQTKLLSNRGVRGSHTNDGLPWQLLSHGTTRLIDNRPSVESDSRDKKIVQPASPAGSLPAALESKQTLGDLEAGVITSEPMPSECRKPFKKKLGLMIPEVQQPNFGGGEFESSTARASANDGDAAVNYTKPLPTTRASGFAVVDSLEEPEEAELGEVNTLHPFSESLKLKPQGTVERYKGLHVCLGESNVPNPETKIKNHKKFEFSSLAAKEKLRKVAEEGQDNWEPAVGRSESRGVQLQINCT